jgi:hypothetical protein
VALPTSAQLNEEVDRSFRDSFPTAPERLDPHDPAQADLVTTWLSIRDGLLNDWTDKAFFSYFPDYPTADKLNPSDPADAQLIEYWNDIHDQIRDGSPGRYDWSAAPQPAAAAAPTEPEASPEPAPAASPAGPDPMSPATSGTPLALTLVVRESVADGLVVVDLTLENESVRSFDAVQVSWTAAVKDTTTFVGEGAETLPALASGASAQVVVSHHVDLPDGDADAAVYETRIMTGAQDWHQHTSELDEARVSYRVHPDGRVERL